MASLLNDKLIIKPLSNNIAIVDNLLNDHVVGHLRLRMQTASYFQDHYNDYQAISYFPKDDLLTDLLAEEISNKFKLEKFQRAWSFLYNNTAFGTNFHSDPSSINVNVWVTPDECIEDYSQNGLLICNVKPPQDWTREQWNKNKDNCITKFLNEQKASVLRVNYRCNRAIIFDGALFHKTDNVKTKEGDFNKRVSYTMLFGRTLE